MARSPRAAPLAPAERRAAIVRATIPLLRTRGWTVTTKEIAAAAEVAEGTIFSVFEDKEELLVEVVLAALDPAPVEERVRSIDPSLPLEDRITAAAEIIQEMATGLWQLLATLQLDEVRRRLPRRLSGDFLDRDVLAAVFAPSRGELRVEPETAAQALMALVLAGSNPLMFQQPLAGPQIVELMLHGIRTSGRRRR